MECYVLLIARIHNYAVVYSWRLLKHPQTLFSWSCLLSFDELPFSFCVIFSSVLTADRYQCTVNVCELTDMHRHKYIFVKSCILLWV